MINHGCGAKPGYEIQPETSFVCISQARTDVTHLGVSAIFVKFDNRDARADRDSHGESLRVAPSCEHDHGEKNSPGRNQGWNRYPLTGTIHVALVDTNDFLRSDFGVTMPVSGAN
jgi:hypothetical protein